MNDEGLIEDVSFEGEGCAISVASASLMTETIKGTPLSEFSEKFDMFQHMVTADLDEIPDDEALGKLAVLSGVDREVLTIVVKGGGAPGVLVMADFTIC